MWDNFSQDEISKIFIIWWHLCFAHNKFFFQDEGFVPSKAAMSIIRFYEDWKHANSLEDCLSISLTPSSAKMSKEVWTLVV